MDEGYIVFLSCRFSWNQWNMLRYFACLLSLIVISWRNFTSLASLALLPILTFLFHLVLSRTSFHLMTPVENGPIMQDVCLSSPRVGLEFYHAARDSLLLYEAVIPVKVTAEESCIIKKLTRAAHAFPFYPTFFNLLHICECI